MWERFSYYGMRALLILFMTAGVARGGLGFSYAKAGAIYGLYTGMVYLLSLPGGWVADRITGQRRAVLYGGILIAAGQFCLVAPSIMTFYLGLVLLVMGTGLLKPNVSTIVGQLYAPGDGRRDAAFSIFYMGINLGALISPFACGWVGEKVGWRLGFGLAGVGMIAGLIQYTLGGKHLGVAGLHPAIPDDPAADRRQKRRVALAAAGALAVLGILGALAATGAIAFYGRADFRRAGGGPGAPLGGHFLLAAAGPRMVRRGAQTFGRDSGSVPLLGRLLVCLRAGRIVAQPVRRGQRRPLGAWIPVPGELVPVGAAVLHHYAGAGVRLALGQAGEARAFQPR